MIRTVLISILAVAYVGLGAVVAVCYGDQPDAIVGDVARVEPPAARVERLRRELRAAELEVVAERVNAANAKKRARFSRP